MILDVASDHAERYLRGHLDAAQGMARFLKTATFTRHFLFVPANFKMRTPPDFAEGGRISGTLGDRELVAWLNANAKNQEFLFQSSWSKPGDFDRISNNIPKYFFFSDQYYFYETNAKEIDIKRWRNFSVAFLEILYVLRSGQLAHLALSAPASRIANGDAANLMKGLSHVFVPALDDETWLGAHVSAH